MRDKRQADGKTTKRVHYINESLLENEALTGRREKLNRDALTEPQLKAFDDLIAEKSALLRRQFKLKTPDAIISATAIENQFEFLTKDKELVKKLGEEINFI